MTQDQLHWINKMQIWIESEKNCMNHTIEALEYSKKQIELHTETIEINSKLIKLYQEAIERAKNDILNYIKENS